MKIVQSVCTSTKENCTSHESQLDMNFKHGKYENGNQY